MTVLLAVLFGLVSAATFTVVQPRLQKKLNPQKPDQVTFPEDEDGTDAADGEDADAEVQDPVIIQEKVELQLSDYASLFFQNERTGGLQQSFPGDGDFGHGRDGLVQ